MKKNLNYYESHRLYSNWQKLLLKMKFTIFLFFVGLISLIAGPGYSQNTKISLNMKDVPIESVLNEIEEVSEFFFLYNHKLIDVERKVDITAAEKPIKDILSEIFTNDVRFIVSDRQIVLTPTQESPALEELIQQQVITGTVTDKLTGNAMPGVNIIVKGSTFGVISDAEGKYSISITDRNATLVFSFIGYMDQEIQLEGRITVDVGLIPEVMDLDEVIVIGYGTRKKLSLTTAVSSIGKEELDLKVSADLRQTLQGMSAGLNVSDFGGAPGRESLSMKIRGISSINGSNPLVLVDGNEQNLSTLNPNIIESISILKDASSTAIYGSRGANGVILVTTKRGLYDEKLNVSYDMNYGLQNMAIQPEYATTEQYMRARNLSLINGGKEAAFTEQAIQAYLKSMNDYPDLYPPAYSPFDSYIQWSPITDHSLSLSGGSRRVASFFNISYLLNEGWLKTLNDENLYQITLNNDFKINDRIKVFSNIHLEQKNTQITNSDFFRLSYYPNDNFCGIAPDGSHLTGQVNRSPLTELDPNIKGFEDLTNNLYSLILGGEINIIKGLTLNSSYSILSDASRIEFMTPRYDLYNFWLEDQLIMTRAENNLRRDNNASFRTTLKHVLTYDKSINDHNINLIAGYTEDEYNYESTRAQGDALYNNEMRSLAQSKLSTRNVASDIQEWGLRSFFARASYNYADKYLIDLSERFDGSSRFPKGNKYASFPSLALAWRMDKENFWEPISKIVSNFKIRASYGITGNQNISNYEYIDQLIVGSTYTFNEKAVTTSEYTTLTSKELTWEKTTQLNLGIDAGFWNNKLTFSFDMYDKETKDILLRLPIAAVVGLTASRSNAGIVSNKGFEIESTWKDNIADFSYDLKINLSYNKDILTDFGGLPRQITAYQGQSFREVGYPVFSCRGMEADGFYQTQSEIDNGLPVATKSTPLIPGDCKFKDVNNDKKITNDDMVFLGSAVPLWNYGFNFGAKYKSIFLTMFWQGAAKFTRFLTHPFCTPMAWSDHVMLKVEAENYWTPDNPNAEWPVPHNSAEQNIYPSTRIAKDASFLRLRNITLGYSLPERIIQSLKMSEFRIFVNARNPIIISKFANKYGMEPEGGTEWEYRSTYYFQTKSYNVGLNLTF